MAIACGVTIENAKGGAGSDRLIGNGAANELSGNDGNDTLTGAGGSDRLWGGAGADTFQDEAAGLDGDTIRDLAVEDRIEALGRGFGSAAIQRALLADATRLAIDTGGRDGADTDLTLSGIFTGTFAATAGDDGSTFIGYRPAATEAALSIAALSADEAEGNAGATPFTFTVARTGDSGTAVSAAWAVTPRATRARRPPRPTSPGASCPPAW